MVAIKGLEKFAAKDFPGHISATVFTGGCNFRCGFCHNSRLVLRPHSLPSLPLKTFLGFLDDRRDWLEAICVTGGEPLMHADLNELLKLIKQRGLLVKLDTNGSFPGRLSGLIKRRLVDSIAMDIKAPLEKYQKVVQAEVAADDLRRSIGIIRESGLDYLFRTTVVPDIIQEEDIERIGRLVRGSPRFQLQQFSPAETIDPEFQKRKPYPASRIEEMADILREHIPEVKLEGVVS